MQTREISLIQTFNEIITNQEEQKQYLLQVDEQHPDKTIQILINQQ